MLKRVVVGSIDADIIAKYVVLAGCFCLLRQTASTFREGVRLILPLFRYMENISGAAYAAHSLRLLLLSNSSHRVAVDRRTAINLELVCNSRTGKQNGDNYVELITIVCIDAFDL